jgi:hypothetical protein
VKLTLVLAAALLVDVKRTLTVWVAPAPARVNGLPETMLNGAATEAVPAHEICQINFEDGAERLTN